MPSPAGKAASSSGCAEATSLEGISLCPETAVCLDVLEMLVQQGQVKRDEEVVVFNTGAAQKYPEVGAAEAAAGGQGPAGGLCWAGVSPRSPSMASEQLLVFLREIKEHPDDDTPRLILADWLQDQGDPRGEFVHLQVVRARLAETDPRYKQIHRRELQILDRHFPQWLGPLIDPVRRWECWRGLIRLEARAERLLDHGLTGLVDDEIFLWVEELRLEDARPHHLTQLAESPLLEQLSTLDLTENRIADAGLARLLASPYLGSLRELRLEGNRISGQGAARLAHCAGLARLQVLDLGRNRLGDAGAWRWRSRRTWAACGGWSSAATASTWRACSRSANASGRGWKSPAVGRRWGDRVRKPFRSAGRAPLRVAAKRGGITSSIARADVGGGALQDEPGFFLFAALQAVEQVREAPAKAIKGGGASTPGAAPSSTCRTWPRRTAAASRRSASSSRQTVHAPVHPRRGRLAAVEAVSVGGGLDDGPLAADRLLDAEQGLIDACAAQTRGPRVRSGAMACSRFSMADPNVPVFAHMVVLPYGDAANLK